METKPRFWHAEAVRNLARRPVVHYVLVWVIACGALLALGRGSSFRPSRDNHFVHMAKGWLDGRVALDGEPPGWSEGRADDWARVWTVQLRSGEAFRGHRCRTSACDEQTNNDRKTQMWWTTSGELVRTQRSDIVHRDATWYVSFPPGPAVLMLPGVAVWGLAFSDVVFTVLLAACIPVVLLAFFERELGRSREHTWLVTAWALGSPACFVAANGRVWFTAQIVAALALTVYVACAWRLRHPLLAGVALSFAVASRPHLLIAVTIFAVWWWQRGRPLAASLRFVAPVLATLVGLAVFNDVRFDDPFEFGHRYLVIRWQDRMQEIGLFSPRYFGRNLTCLLALWPQWHGGAWPLRISIHGLGLLWTTPWLLWAIRARQRFDARAVLWLTAAAIALPSLLYQNSGQLQFTYRFALDWLPLVIIAMGLGGVMNTRGIRTAIVFAVIVQVAGAWMFAHERKRLFVREPIGWPFEDEFLRR